MRKLEGKRPLRKPIRWWADTIKILGDTDWGGVDWIYLAQDRDQWRALVNAAINLWVPQNAGKFLSGCTTGSASYCNKDLLRRDPNNAKWAS
jgi:hypothetical protein